MEEKQIRQYFLGGNTGLGFYNLFDGITPKWEKTKWTYVLKGGPGVGKNTMMRKFAQTAMDKGYHVELFHCSGDPDSLDGVRVVERGLVMLDGTAPHVIDPVRPGAADGIINLGIFIEEEKLKEDLIKIDELFRANQNEYKKVYAYLMAARKLKAAGIESASCLTDTGSVEVLTEGCKGRMNRHIFIDAITHKGWVDYSREYEADSVYTVTGDSRYTFMEELAANAGDRAVLIHDCILGDGIKAVYIPQKDCYVTTEECEGAQVIESDRYKDAGVADFIEYNENVIAELTGKAVKHLAVCKEIHDDIEKIYSKTINFDGVNKKTQEIIQDCFDSLS